MNATTLDYEDCVERKLMKDGTVEIHCKLGLWSVSGRNRHQVEAEAMHYFVQYAADREYRDYEKSPHPCTTPESTTAT